MRRDGVAEEACWRLRARVTGEEVRENAADRIKTRPGPFEDLGEERCRAPRVVATRQLPLFLVMLLLMLCWLLLALLLAGSWLAPGCALTGWLPLGGCPWLSLARPRLHATACSDACCVACTSPHPTGRARRLEVRLAI